MHEAVDLSGTVYDFQVFLDDVIGMSKPGSDEHKVNVEDYVRLLEKHQGSSHRFIHQVLKNGKEISEEYRRFLHIIADRFRVSDDAASASAASGAGVLTERLNALVANLSPAEREIVLKEVEAHATYLKTLSSTSSVRTRELMNASGSSTVGPGVYLARWQALLDSTLITPAEAAGAVRTGANAEVRNAARVDTDGEKKGGGEEDEVARKVLEAPVVEETVRLLINGYKECLREVSHHVW